MTGGTPPMSNAHTRGKRTEVQGWSESATRRNTAFLRSIREDKLDGAGYALTLTLRDCPPSPRDWHRLRDLWEKRVRRLGMIRLHWVTEWTRRGNPHLHCAIWFPDPYTAHKAVDAWIDLACDYGAGKKGQHCRLIDAAVGWFQYLSKHASRGVKHYQRNPESIPEQWRGNTGRMWGKSGVWPIEEPIKMHLQDHTRGGDGGYFALRRLVRSWRIAQARAAGDISRIRYARRMFSAQTKAQSQVRGFSEWIPRALQMRMLENIVERGFSVELLG